MCSVSTSLLKILKFLRITVGEGEWNSVSFFVL